MNIQDALMMCPHLASPAALARTDTYGKFQLPPHLALINRELAAVPFTSNARLMINVPFQFGKSTISSHFFPAWNLLLFPETRIILVANTDTLAASFGSKVKDTIDKFGGLLGIHLKKDTKAKDEWVISKHGGGMVCRGVGGSLLGRPADLLLLDDLIRDAEEAMSPTMMEKHWDWYTTSAYSRLGPTAGIVNVGTRWGTRDIFGRALAEAKKTGETWKHIKIKAIAGKDDILGRKPGEGLWNERVPLERLQRIAAARGKWFDICWQQEPQDEEGGHFRPATWPLYDDLGDAWSVQEDAATGRRRTIVMKNDVIILVTVDWATSERKTSDYTAMGVFGIIPDGRMLILDMVNERLRLEQCVPRLAQLCRVWRPQQVAVEAQGFQAALANDCRRYPEIPEPRRLQPESKANAKLRRALPAIVMGENKRIHMPSQATATLMRVAGATQTHWSEEFVAQLQAFTGIDDDHDDMVDCLAYACQVAQQLKPHFHDGFDAGPCVLTAGRGFE